MQNSAFNNKVLLHLPPEIVRAKEITKFMQGSDGGVVNSGGGLKEKHKLSTYREFKCSRS